MSNKSLARLIRIVTGTFGTARDELLSFDTTLSRFEKFVHFWVLVCHSFARNRCFVRASSLAYTTMLALIPMLFVAMSVTNVFLKSEGQERIEQFIQAFVDRVIPAPDAPGPEGANSIPVVDPLTNDFAPIGLDVTNFVAPLSRTNTPTTEAAALLPTLSPLTNDFAPIVFEMPGLAAHRSDTNQPALAAAGEHQALTRQKVSKQVAAYIHKFVKNTSSSAVGTLGMLGLLLTAIMTLTRVEETFNDIWGVSRGRNWLARVIQYWAAITLGPLLLLAALGLASGPRFQKTRELISIFPYLDLLVSTLLPVFVLCLTFALLYKLMPNTKVDFSAAFVGGAVAGVAWHTYNNLGFLLASQVVNADKLYGSIALILLFMGGLYIAWLTVVFGAQVAYAYQNRSAYLQEKLADNVNQRGREFVALRLMTCIGQRFHRGLPPVTIREISAELGIPGKLAQQVLHTLLAAHLVVEVAGLENGYAPARPLDAINTHHILLAMRAAQGQELDTRDEPVRVEVLGEFARIQAAEKEAASSVSLLALVNRAQARLELALPVGPGNSQPGATSQLVTTLTESGLVEESPAATPDTPTPPADIRAKPKIDFTPETASSPVPADPEPKSKTTTNVAPIAPLASTANENESFPL